MMLVICLDLETTLPIGEQLMGPSQVFASSSWGLGLSSDSREFGVGVIQGYTDRVGLCMNCYLIFSVTTCTEIGLALYNELCYQVIGLALYNEFCYQVTKASHSGNNHNSPKTMLSAICSVQCQA